MTFDDILEQTRPDQDNYDNAVAMSQRFQKATESPDFSENPFLNLEDAAKASRNPVNRVYNENDLKNITSDVGTIAWDSFRKGVMDLQSVGDKADMALGNTLAGISGNTLGTEMRDRAADSLMKTMEESRFIDSNYGDAETWTARFVGGGMSMAEMLAVGAATGMAGLGAYVGTLSLSDGALNDMVKYQEEHGNLDGYETDPKNLALDYGNAVFQVASELMLGTGRLVSGKFLKAGKTGSAIAKEALDNFIQESSQGAVSDITEILKGNKDIDVLKENVLGYIKDGIVAGVLGGAIGGSAYKLNKNRALQNLDKINAALNPNATQEEIRQKSEEVFEKTEEQQLKTFVPELIAQNEAVNDKGSIRDNLQKKVAAMYDEAEDMSEQQKAKAIEATTSLELENILYDSVERKIPLTANPLLQGEVNELGWFREGIPENRQTEIENLRQEYVNLRDELKAQNESAEKNYDKIEELENKIELFRRELPNRLQDLVVADRAELRKMLAEQRERVATSQAKKRMISAIQKKAQSAIKAQITAENKLAEQMARGAEKAQLQREKKETAQQTKEAKIRNLQEQRDIARAIKNVKVDIARKKAKESVVEPDYTEDTGYNSLKQQGYTDEQIAKMSMQEIEKSITTESLDITLPTKVGESVEFEYNGDKYKITRAHNGYLLEIADGKSAIEISDNGLVKETYTLPDERNKGLATKNVLMAERLFGDLTITISKDNTDAENFWFGLGYTKEIADRKFVKEPQVYHQEEREGVRPETARINYLESNLAEWQEFLDTTIANNTNNWNAEILEDNKKRAKKAISNIKKEIKELQESLKEPIEEKLYATHNMSLAGVKGALKLGGLAMPSLAIRKVSQGNINQFGDIVFVGGTKLVEPSKTTEVYDRDAWTPSLAYNMRYELNDKGKKFITDIASKHKSDHSPSVFLYNIEENIDTPKSNSLAMQLYCLDRGIDYDSISHYELSNSLDYLTWYEENITGNSDPYLWAENADNTDMKKYKYTLDNMMRILKRQERSGGGFIGDTVLTTQHLLQFMANKYKNLQEIKANKNKLVSREEQTNAISEIDEAFYQLADELKLDGKTYEHYENRTGLAIAAINKESEIKENLDRYNLDSSDESVEKVKQFTQKMKDVVTDYFEVKPRRIVDFNEFSGVIVPNGAEYDDVASKLENAGVFVQRVEKGNESEYQDALMEIQRRYKTVLFQSKTTGGKDTYRGAYLPEYRFIAKTENMDASTLNHELAHDWGQEYFRWARSGKASESFLRSWGAVEKAIGITDNDTYFTYDASEKFARAYEGWLLQKKDWAKILKIDNDDDKKAVESMMEDYRQELVDIYESLLESSKYFKGTFGEIGELKPELVEFFERAVNYDDIDVRAKRGEITQEQAAEEKLNQMLENSVEAGVESMPVAQVQDADAITQVQDLQQVANDTERFETEGGNKKALQRRLDNIALAQDLTQNDKDLGKYDSHRDMLAVAEQADEFVRNRREDALAIINGEMAEQDGLYASDLYTALERVANSTGDFDLIEELRNSKMANEMAKELGQRVAGFRNYKGSGDVDVISVLNSLEKQLKTSYNQNKDTADEYIGALVAELKIADNNAKLDEFFDEMECK